MSDIPPFPYFCAAMETLYLAPLQGFTDFVYRSVYSTVFGGMDAYFIPYITLKNGEIARKYLKETAPANNLQQRVIPQIMVGNSSEAVVLARYAEEQGYKEICLNLGCPFPMVANQTKGSGLLPFPQLIDEITSTILSETNLLVTIKLRAGLKSFDEIDALIPVFNRLQLKELIFHPRIATQLYKGEINTGKFLQVKEKLIHPLVYNGDIFSSEEFWAKKTLLPGTYAFMLGRGVLMNPFLPAEINGDVISPAEKREKLVDFHEKLVEKYLQVMDNPGNVVDKMKQFWAYFSYSFADQHKTLKRIKKTGNLNHYLKEASAVFRNA